MWDNLTFTDLDHIYKNYKNNLGWWAWLTGEQNAAHIVAVEEFINCGLAREDKKLTEADKLAFITVLAVLRQKIRWENSSLNYLVQNFWNRTCSYAMQEVLCDIATLSQLTPEVFNALQRNAPVNKVLATQAVAPGELTLNFIKSVLFSHLHPLNAITPLYLQWCSPLGKEWSRRLIFIPLGNY